MILEGRITSRGVLVPVDPETLPARLERAGFRDVEVEAAPRTFRFRATAA